MQRTQYFIAIIPPKDITENITRIKEEISEKFNTTKALKNVPHITLKIPFWLTDEPKDSLFDWFEKTPVNTLPFSIRLKDFGSFCKTKHPVLFISVETNSRLTRLHDEIIDRFFRHFQELTDTGDRKFKPHITIAYRDLDKSQFHRAWDELKSAEFEAVFEVSELYLLAHDGKKWNIARRRRLRTI